MQTITLKGKTWEEPQKNNYKGGTSEFYLRMRMLMTDILRILAALQVKFHLILEQQWNPEVQPI